MIDSIDKHGPRRRRRGGAFACLMLTALLAMPALPAAPVMRTLAAAQATASAEAGGTPEAEARAALAERLQQIRVFTAAFTQTVYGSRGEILEQSAGRVWLDRPNFKWKVDDPYPQVLVTEGDELKLYDPDLEQLTVRPLEEALQDTPVSLLTRDAVELTENFRVIRLGGRSEASFVIEPTAEDTLYREIVLHFDGGTLAGLDILDHLGQRTEVRFDPDEGVSRIEPGTFVLDVPPGTDVIGG